MLSSLVLHNKNDPFLDWIVTYDKSEFYMTTSDGHICTKKTGPGHWWSAASLIHYSFLNPGKTITSEKNVQQINEMQWKLQCLQPTLVNRKGPILHNNTCPHITQPALQKLNKLGYKVLPHLPYSPDISPTEYHFFKHLDNFCRKNASQNQQNTENAFQEFVEFWSTDSYATGINKLISCWQNVLIVKIPILINKHVFKPNYNNLKFSIQNLSYFCTNLIVLLLSCFSRVWLCVTP